SDSCFFCKGRAVRCQLQELVVAPLGILGGEVKLVHGQTFEPTLHRNSVFAMVHPFLSNSLSISSITRFIFFTVSSRGSSVVMSTPASLRSTGNNSADLVAPIRF